MEEPVDTPWPRRRFGNAGAFGSLHIIELWRSGRRTKAFYPEPRDSATDHNERLRRARPMQKSTLYTLLLVGLALLGVVIFFFSFSMGGRV